MCNVLQHRVGSKSEAQERKGKGFEFAPERAEHQNLALRLGGRLSLRNGFNAGQTIALPKLIRPAQIGPGYENV